MNTDKSLFKQFQSVIQSPQAPIVRDPRLLMEQEGALQVYYAPFEYVNPGARLVLVGITPGPTQMFNANTEARRVLLSGGSDLEAMQAAKQVAAFSGKSMRSNLINQLDHWGFNRWLGIRDSAELFAEKQDLLQTTSLLRYPVFVDGKDYRGTPDMIKTPILRRQLMAGFVREVQALPDVVFIGLGPAVQKVLNRLVVEGILSGDQVIGGMLHPSPNCTYRINYLIGSRNSPIPYATKVAPYDAGRNAFSTKYLGIRPSR